MIIKKNKSEFYIYKKKPSIIEVPTMNYIAVRGKCNPNEENGEYKESIGLLCGIGYTIKMSYKGSINEHDGLKQVGIAKIDKVIYNPEAFNILYVSFHAEDTGVYDVDRIAYFNRFSIAPDEYIEHLYEVTTDE